MSAQPARQILRWKDEHGVFLVELKQDEWSQPKWVELAELSRVELIKLASKIFQDIPGNKWFRVSVKGIQSAIVTRQAPDFDALDKPKAPAHPILCGNPAPIPVPEIPEDRDGQWDEEENDDLPITLPISETTPLKTLPRPLIEPANSGAGSIDAIIRQIALNAAQGAVNEDKVREIVNGAIITALSNIKPQVTRVEVKGREAVEISGRQHKVFPSVLKVLGAGMHVYLVGPSGTGKSTIAEKAAEALGLGFGSISLGPTTPH